MKKRVFILLLAVFNAVGVYALNINSTSTQTGGNDIVDGNLIVGDKSAVTYTINGNLTVNGSMTVYNGSSVIVNGTLHVTGTINVNGDITVNGRVEATTVNVNKTVTVNSGAVLHTTQDLNIAENGTLTLSPKSTTVVEHDLNQNGRFYVLRLDINTGNLNADQATLVVANNYNIFSVDLLLVDFTDDDATYIDPAHNEVYVFGKNDLTKVDGITAKPKDEDAFIDAYPMGLDGFVEAVMPIELVYFEAYNSGDQVYFKWQTASELNNDYFTIECSTDAEDFEPLATIQGSGTTNYTVDYDYQYRLNYVGTMYYRLKQTDYDGSSTYSKTEAVTFTAKAVTKTNDFTIYPNPAVDFVTIAGGEYESVAFVSADGKIVSEQASQNSHSVEMLPKGLNIVVIRTANGNVSKTIIKQ